MCCVDDLFIRPPGLVAPKNDDKGQWKLHLKLSLHKSLSALDVFASLTLFYSLMQYSCPVCALVVPTNLDENADFTYR